MSPFTSIHAALMALILITNGGGISSQGLLFKKCPKPWPQQDFVISTLEGQWFPRYQFSSKFSACTKFEFNQSSATSLDLTTFTRTDVSTDLKVGAQFVAVDSNEPAYMKLVWNMFPQIRDQVTVISTQRDLYALLFFCTDFGLFHYQAGVIFTRKEASLPSEIVMETERQMQNITGSHLVALEQRCPWIDHPAAVANESNVKSFSFDDIFKHASMALQLMIQDRH